MRLFEMPRLSVNQPRVGAVASNGNTKNRFPASLSLAVDLSVIFLSVGWMISSRFLSFIQAGITLALLLLLVSRCFTRQCKTVSTVDYVVLGWLALAILRSVFQQSPRNINEVTGMLTAALIFFHFRRLSYTAISTYFALRVFSIVAAVTSLIWIWICVQWLSKIHAIGMTDAVALKTFRPTPSNSTLNEFLAVLVLIAAVQLVLLWSPDPTPSIKSWIPWCGICLTMASILLVFSRMGYIELAILLALSVGAQWRYSKSLFTKSAVTAALMVVVAIVVNHWTSGAVLTTARMFITQEQQRSATARVAVWGEGWRIGLQHWCVGGGFGSFARAYLPIAHVEEGRPYITRPLNTVLSILAERGFIGVLSELAILGVVLWHATEVQRRGSRTLRFKISVLVGGLAVFWLGEMTDSALTESSLVRCLYFIVLALSCQKNIYRARSQGCQPRAYILFCACICAMSILVGYEWYSHQVAEHFAELAVEELASGYSTLASEHAARAEQVDSNPYYQTLRAQALILHAMPGFDPQVIVKPVHDQDARKKIQKALALYDLAIAALPQDDALWHNRAWIRLALGEDIRTAEIDMEHAIAIDGSESTHRISLGLMLEWTGDIPGAENQYAAALFMNPELVNSRFAREHFLQSPDLWRNSLMQAMALSQERNRGRGDPLLGARLGALYLAEGNASEGVPLLMKVSSEMQEFPRVWANLGRISLNDGDREIASLYLRRALFLDPEDMLVISQLADLESSEGDEADAVSLRSRLHFLVGHRYSSHAARVAHLYDTHAVVLDDILPSGLLAYCGTAVSDNGSY
jgi:tetratricopeptide (TPR) repeat protein